MPKDGRKADGNETANPNMIVTPWQVEGIIDYDRLVEEFGTQLIDESLLAQMRNFAGELHFMLRRGFFFSHRDFNLILDRVERGEPWALYTGRGPSGHTTLGHISPWIFTKHLQDVFGVDLYFQLTDDEKFLYQRELSLSDVERLTYENALDVLAIGFDPRRTHLISDIRMSREMRELSLEVAKRVTFSTVRAVFGFTNETNIGMIFHPAVQAAPCFLPSRIGGTDVPTLIPCAIDQDPYWRVARDVAPRIGYPKPCGVYCKFFPGLAEGGKMSSSKPETAIYTTDTPELARQKVMGAYTGGRATVEEQRRLGADPNICTIFWSFYFMFEPDDEKIENLRKTCAAGEILCGDCKVKLADSVAEFLEEHQRRRKDAEKIVNDLFI